MKTLFKFLALLFCFTNLSSQAQVKTRSYYADEGLVPREQVVDMQKLNLKISFLPEEGKVMGQVSHDFKVLRQQVDSLFLDAIRMEFSEVKLDGKEVKHKNTGRGIWIYFPQALNWDNQHKLSINYTAYPKKGIYFIGWNDETNRSRKQIWTQGQGINNRHWIPMYDEKNDKVISEVEVTFDEKYQVLSNGQKIKEKKVGDGLKTWQYRISHPHAPYLIMLGIGEYAIYQTKSASGVPMNLYYYPEQPEQREPTYRYSVRMFDFFEKEIGVPYPWKTYSQIPVQDFMYGAMENTTATIFGDFYLVDSRAYLDRNYVRVDAHELAHQWFGDMVTARASAHHWLQESFATHYDMMYQKEAFGQDHFDWVRRNYNNQAIEESKNDLKPIAHSHAGTVRHYPKGAFVLQMLKEVVGREQFNAAIKYYLEKHAYGNVNSQDLLVAFHERLGLSLNWFWEEWIYKGGEPHYEVSFHQNNKELSLQVKQVQEKNDLVGLFEMPILLEVHLQSGKVLSQKPTIAQETETFYFEIPDGEEVAFVLFDPNNQVMKSVTFEKSTEMLLAQAKNAPFMLDRYDALVELGKREFEGKEDFLLERFKAESFHGIKGEIIAQMLPTLTVKSQELTKMALADSDAEVRKIALESTFRIPADLEPNYRVLLTDSSYENIEKALDLLAFYYPSNLSAYLELTENEMGNRAHNVRISYLALLFNAAGDTDALAELIDYTSESYEFLTRVKAAEKLQEINILNEEALGHMLQATFSFNSRLRGPVSKVLDHFFEQSAYKGMIVSYVSRQEWTDDEFKRVKKYLIP